MTLGPVFAVGLLPAGWAVAVTGDNDEAADKVERLLHAGASVSLYAPDLALPALETLHEAARIEWHGRRLEPAEVSKYRLVLSTWYDKDYNAAISEAAHAEGVLVCCLDKHALSDFALPALARSGKLQIAVFTEGASPALARRIRLSLESIFDARFAAFLDGLGRLRSKLQANDPDGARRRESLRQAVDGFEIEGSIKYPDTKIPDAPESDSEA